MVHVYNIFELMIQKPCQTIAIIMFTGWAIAAICSAIRGGGEQ